LITPGGNTYLALAFRPKKKKHSNLTPKALSDWEQWAGAQFAIG